MKDKDAVLFSHQYALGIIGKQLEQISGLPLQEIQAQAQAYGIGYLVNQYFDCIDMPEEGDLVIYPNATGNAHTGIYRKSEPNWRSPYGGTVESKWGQQEVYKHPLFHVGNLYGNFIRYYRLKPEVV